MPRSPRQIPPAAELHATPFINGRGNSSQNPGVNMSKRVRQQVGEQALATICGCAELHVGAVYRQTPARKKEYAVERNATYAGLVSHLDTRLGAAGENGLIIMVIVDGTHEGLAAARARGQRLGRPPAMSEEQVRQARALLTRPDESVSSIARLLGISRTTLYKYVPELSGKHQSLS